MRSASGAPATPRIAPGPGVPLAVDLVPAARVVHGAGGHLVQGQGAGLVGVDLAGGPKGLDVVEVAHDGLGLGQLLGAHREHRLDEGGHAGGDRRHGH